MADALYQISGALNDRNVIFERLLDTANIYTIIAAQNIKTEDRAALKEYFPALADYLQ